MNRLSSEVKRLIELRDSRVEGVGLETAQKTQELYALAVQVAGEQAVIEYYGNGLDNVPDTELIRLAQQVFPGKYL